MPRYSVALMVTTHDEIDPGPDNLTGPHLVEVEVATETEAAQEAIDTLMGRMSPENLQVLQVEAVSVAPLL